MSNKPNNLQSEWEEASPLQSEWDEAVPVVAKDAMSSVRRMAGDYVRGIGEVGPKLMPQDLPTAAATGAAIATAPLGPAASIPAYMVVKQGGRMIEDAFKGQDTSSLSKTVLGDLPEAALMTGKPMDWLMNAGKSAKTAARNFIGNKPERIVQNLVRPSTTLTPPEVDKLTGDILKYGGLPTEGGWKNINRQIQTQGGNLESFLSEHAGKSVSRNDIVDALHGQIAKMRAAGAPSSEIAVVENKLLDLSNRFPQQIPIGTAQAGKQRIYKQNEPYYGMNPNDPAIQAEKGIGESLKSGIETATGDPRIAETNAVLGDLLNMRSAVGRATNRLENNNPLSLGGSISLNTATKNPVVGAIAGAVNNPTVKANAAKAMYALRNKIGSAPAQPQNLSNIGSPYKALEDFLWIKYEPKYPYQGMDLVAPKPNFQRRGPVRDTTTPNFTMSDKSNIKPKMIEGPPQRPQIGYEPNFTMSDQPSPARQLPPPQKALPDSSFPITETGQAITPLDIQMILRGNTVGDLPPVSRMSPAELEALQKFLGMRGQP